MKISFRWLERHVDLSGLTADEVANDLTVHTAEVEGAPVPFAPCLAEVVVGHVLERAKHPNADKLSLCRVDIGSGTLLEIVCGAANVAAGQRVAVAQPGTTLPGKGKLGKTKIRGVESQGMICSERELELSDEHEGIWVLPGEPRIGATVQEALGSADWVIEIDNKSLTHRPDCWGHRGIAREIAAIRRRPLKPLDLAFPSTEPGDPYPVRVESAGCSRYLGLLISGVKNGPAPVWMRFLLLAVGQRPLDLLVDLSNFVMLDLGQPNHLFDLARLDASGIRVRDARPGETMRTLDGVQRELTADDVLICSGDEAVALAGVMGGEASSVRPETSELLLEAATFHPTRVRRTAARLGLRTDASARFEKNLDPTLPAKAAAHLVNLLRALQPGIRLPRPRGDAGDWRDPARTVALRPARVREVLGADVLDGEIERILTSLEFQVTKTSTSWSVGVPSARATKDVTIEADLIEEVGRMHGYGNIPERALTVQLTPVPWNDRLKRLTIVQHLADRLGGTARFHEAMTYSFLDATTAAKLDLKSERYVPVVNPQIEGLDRVRRSVLPSLLAHLEKNRRQRAEVRLFEIGKGYLPELANERGEPRENHELGLVWMAPRPGKQARFDEHVQVRLQGVVDDLFRDVGRERPRWERLECGAPRWAHGERCMVAAAQDGRPAALLAALEPEIQGRLGLTGELDGEVACAIVSIDVLEALGPSLSRYRPLARFPATKVDVAVAVPEERSAREVLAALWQAGAELVVGGEVFDIYRGPSVGPGRKSLAVHVFLQAEQRTLTDKDVAKYLKQVERGVMELGGELRKE